MGERMIALIVAYSKNHVIGNQGIIPWKIKGEQTRFKELTTGNVVVMGKGTFEEIGKPLPNRTTILVSSTLQYKSDNCIMANSLDDALEKAGTQDVYISGGARLYQEALPIVDKMYVTLVEREYEGDTYFPNFNESDFEKTFEQRYDGEIPYVFITYERIMK
jgi:dihydrofolate reductase